MSRCQPTFKAHSVFRQYLFKVQLMCPLVPSPRLQAYTFGYYFAALESRSTYFKNFNEHLLNKHQREPIPLTSTVSRKFRAEKG